MYGPRRLSCDIPSIYGIDSGNVVCLRHNPTAVVMRPNAARHLSGMPDLIVAVLVAGMSQAINVPEFMDGSRAALTIVPCVHDGLVVVNHRLS